MIPHVSVIALIADHQQSTSKTNVFHSGQNAVSIQLVAMLSQRILHCCHYFGHHFEISEAQPQPLFPRDLSPERRFLLASEEDSFLYLSRCQFEVVPEHRFVLLCRQIWTQTLLFDPNNIESLIHEAQIAVRPDGLVHLPIFQGRTSLSLLLQV